MTLPENPSMEILIKGCIKGERRCQQKVFEKFYGKMMSVCLRYSKGMDDAQDILQDGFIKVFKNIRRYKGDGSFEGWMRRIIVNTAIDHYRKKKNAAVIADSEYVDIINEETDIDDSDDFEMIAECKNEEILKAVQQLSPAYKAVFNLYVVEGYSHKEIAEMLGIAVGSSKSNLAKAKMKLKKILKGVVELR